MELLFEARTDIRFARLSCLTEVNELITLFEAISSELSWQPGTQLRDYQSEAMHFGVVASDAIVGGMQVVPSASSCPPYCRVWPELYTPERSDIAHVTILAFEKPFRGKYGIFWPLCVELWRWCVSEKITEIRIEVTPPTLRLYRRIGWPLEIIGELRPHWGEECYLTGMSVAAVEAAVRQRALVSEAFEKLVCQGYRDRDISACPETAIDHGPVL